MRYLFGDYTLDTQRYELRRAEQRMALEPKAFDLLLYLVEHRGRVVGRDELLGQVWPKQFISDHSLTARLRAVRQVLQDDARQPRFIETMHGRGYRFIGSVRTTSEIEATRDVSPLPVTRQPPVPAEDSLAATSAVTMVGREAAVAAYLTARCPEALDLVALTQFIHQRTEGNPLFMVNLVDQVVAQGVMEKRGVPESLHHLLEQRLERLSPDTHRGDWGVLLGA